MNKVHWPSDESVVTRVKTIVPVTEIILLHNENLNRLSPQRTDLNAASLLVGEYFKARSLL